MAVNPLLGRSKIVPPSRSVLAPEPLSLLLIKTRDESEAENYYSSPSTHGPIPTGEVEDLTIAFPFFAIGSSQIWGVFSLFLAHRNFWLLIICYGTEHHHALGSDLLQSESSGDTHASFSYFLHILFYNLIAARESKRRTRPADPCSAF